MYVLSSVGVSVRSDHVDVVEDVCRSTQCGGAGDPELGASLIVLTALLSVGLVMTFRHIEEARSLVTEEHTRTAAELDAFTEFKRRVSGIEPTRSVPTNGNMVAMANGSTDRQLEQVQNAYRETIMSVPHYEDEYDEPFEVNMTAELGEEVAVAVVDGSRFTEQVKRGLISQCNEGRRRRAELIRTLNREERRLMDAQSDLSEVESALESETPDSIRDHGFPELSDRWERLGTVKDRCQDLLDDHAAARKNTPEERPEFREYVYSSLPTEYPILSETTRLLDRITDRRRTILRALTRRA
jgi:hypothetical protein